MRKMPARTFWIRLKEALLRARKPATQIHVAKVLGIEQPSVSDWNKPGGFPEVERAVKAALYANVCVEWLFTERGPQYPIPEDPTAQRLWTLWPQLDDITKGKIIGIAEDRAHQLGEDRVPRSKRA